MELDHDVLFGMGNRAGTPRPALRHTLLSAEVGVKQAGLSDSTTTPPPNRPHLMHVPCREWPSGRNRNAFRLDCVLLGVALPSSAARRLSTTVGAPTVEPRTEDERCSHSMKTAETRLGGFAGRSNRRAWTDRLLPLLVELSFAHDMARVSDAVRRGVRDLTGADGVTFVLKDGEYCLYFDEDAIAPLWKGRRFPLNQCVSGWVMTHRQTAAIPDIYEDDRIPQDAYRPTFVRSLLMVPVRQEDPVAAIGVYWAQRHEATPGEQGLVQAVANGAALAMANVQLVRDLEQAADRERRARLTAERANALTEQFLLTVSHELRTPLGVIRGWLWQLRQPGVTEDVLRHGLAVVERNAAIQARLVEDLLDSSGAVTGAIRLRRTMLDLNGICTVVAEAQRPAADGKGLRLVVERSASPLLVYGDLDRLQQIVSNLVDNAIKFTPPGGEVSLKAGVTNGRASVSVRDAGIGMAPALLPHIFDRFWMRDGSPTRETGGLGLGLTIVQELVRLHGGLVRAESPGEGEGATVTVELPVPVLREEPGEWLRRRAGGVVEGRPALALATVLVISEDGEGREALQHLLEANGARVLAASSVERVATIMADDPPDVVLADTPFTSIDERDLVRVLQVVGDQRRCAATVVMRAQSEPIDEPGGVGDRLFGACLEKPIAPEELVARLAQAVSRQGSEAL
jgi:signal transduction histidine kinase